MPDIFDYLSPVEDRFLDLISDNNFMKRELVFSNKNQPDIESVKIAILGIEEDRRSLKNGGCSFGANTFRNELYQLFPLENSIEIADIGNIQAGNTYEDTCFALKSVCEYLLKNDIIPLLIGGSQDLTFANYQSYENLEMAVNLVNIDFTIDLGDEDELNSNNYLRNIVLHKPNFLFNFCNIGHQRPLVSGENIQLLDSMFFDTLRLGRLFDDVKESEPYLRNADMVSIDLGSIRRSDSPGSRGSGPNGLYADQMCQMCKYAGMSDKLSSFGIYEYNPGLDQEKQTSQLIAEMIWYFAEGVSNRKNDFPIGSKEDYLKFTVPLDREDYEIIFYKSQQSDRWWMEVPYTAGTKNRYQRHHLVPCTHNDYKTALNDDIPDLWWRTFQKLV